MTDHLRAGSAECRTGSSFTPSQIIERSRARCAAAWDRDGLAVVAKDDPVLDDWERQFLANIIAKIRKANG
jgi:hypothetical protein